MAKVKTLTLGCKVNQYETEFVREGLLRIGYQDAVENEEADLCIVNTCTVTNEGDSKSRQAIRRLNRENPSARIVVMGCYATRAPEEVSSLPGVAEVVTDKRELPDLLGRFGVVDIPTGITGLSHRSRAYVKIQDGCLLRCSYCIIPTVRPNMFSRRPEHVLDEIKAMVGNGYREVVLTGVHLGHYGVDFNFKKPKHEWVRLAGLVRQIMDIPGNFRIRLSSIEATEVTHELLTVMADFPDRVCPHLHVCLQSGSDEILRKMKRRWGTQRFLDRCHLTRDVLDNPALTTDVIVGFPGETDAHFEETLATCEEARFSKIHIFPFSARKGTPAADYPDQVSGSVKAERSDRLTLLEKQMREQYADSLQSQQLQVLIEAENHSLPGRSVGASCRYISVSIPKAPEFGGKLISVRVTGKQEDRLVGEPILGA